MGIHWFQHTQIVTLELSNLCNYARLHAKCPAHLVQNPEILSTAAILDVLHTLSDHGFGPGKFLAFHVYNEPLLDPRLFKIVEQAKALLPEVGMILWSNGWYLHEPIAAELVDAGITHFMVSAYSDEEFERFEALREWLRQRFGQESLPRALPVYFQVRRVAELDDRMQRQTLAGHDSHMPCHQPLNNLTIRASGDIGLCCYDWSQEMKFGNIHRRSFAECLAETYPTLERLHEGLARGERELPVCQRCSTPRRPASETVPLYWPNSTLVREPGAIHP